MGESPQQSPVDATAQALLYARDLAQLNKLRRLYEKLLPVGVDPKTQALPEPTVRDATLLFTDLRGSSAIAERLEGDPARLLGMLNEHFDVVVSAILRCGGIVEKLLGDGVFASFGAWSADPDHAARGMAAAIAVVGANEALNRRRAAEWGRRLEVGVGLCSGRVITGVVGPKERFELGVLGDAVNVAARLVAEAGPGEILLSTSTYQTLEGKVQADLLGDRLVRGREGAVSVYRLQLAA